MRIINKQNQNWQSVGWFAMLFVVASIGFADFIAFYSTDSKVIHVLLIPNMAFAIGVLIYKFVKK